ncbi:MAG: shikimate kinase [Lachnospiraceae bacterium]|nr:shikimate kinase [Lachnospiraceae bacterium]MBQ8549001.1 shikimate kinase [Lachnospiraceae bacterium]MBQ8846437.1 shikimate kinase [Lachnospiraceae bacterium]
MKKDNIILIGMPGAGKSTLGVLLARAMNYRFMDTDLLIQEREGRLLCEIIAQEGMERFLEIEGDVNAGIHVERTVIAPGGSAIYSEKAMKHFSEIGTVVYLHVPVTELSKRLGDLKRRGVVLKEGQNLNDLYEERRVYYERYAQITVDVTKDEIGEVLADMVQKLKEQRL